MDDNQKLRRSCTIAYSSFFFLGLVALFTAIVFPAPEQPEYQGFAFLGLFAVLGIPIGIAIILSTWFAFKSGDTLLIMLWFVTLIALPLGFVAVLSGRPLILGLWGALAVILSVRSFAPSRRGASSKPQGRE